MRLRGKLLALLPQLLALVALRAAGAAELAVPRALPAGHAVDGLLTEWSTPPLFVLGAAQQVAGSSKVEGAGDLEAKVWLAFTEQGLALAVDVTDDRVAFPSPERSLVAADHVELWIAFPAATMPPIGYANQFGVNEVPDAEVCEGLDGVEPLPCKEWHAAQVARRKAFARLFVRQYLISPAGIEEAYFGASGGKWPDDEPFAKPPCCAASRSKVVPRQGGYVVEALVALADLPPSARAPLDTFSVLVDVADDDSGTGKGPDSFLSSSPRRRFGDVATFDGARLDPPLLFESEPPFVRWIFEGAGSAEALFYFPATRIEEVFGFENGGVGYQYQPEEPSPRIQTLVLPKQPARRVKDVDLFIAPGDLGPYGVATQYLVSMHGGRRISTLEFKSSCDHDELDAVHVHEAAGCTLVAFVCRGSVSPFGAGMCGGCPMASYDVVAVAPDGAVASVGGDDNYIACNGNMVEALPPSELEFGFRCEEDADAPDPEEELEEWHIRWDGFTCGR